jgi:hypothetical protein
VHRFAGITRFRLLMIAVGYEDGNDADELPGDLQIQIGATRTDRIKRPCRQVEGSGNFMVYG